MSEAARDDDTVTEGAREALLLVEGVRESVASTDELRDVLRVALTDLESVRVIDRLDDTLGDTELDSVSEGVKLGETGDGVTEGVIECVGMIVVYDMKNTDPEPRLIIWAPIWAPPES